MCLTYKFEEIRIQSLNPSKTSRGAGEQGVWTQERQYLLVTQSMVHIEPILPNGLADIQRTLIQKNPRQTGGHEHYLDRAQRCEHHYEHEHTSMTRHAID
ncbi:hypothetical protein CsSME_00031407 [Camellia sinensis var. sinensis]